MDNDEVKIVNKSLIDKYRDRPLRLEQCSLLKFAQSINVRGNEYQTARKDKVVRILPNLKLSPIEDNEPFYKLQCILHIPFRKSYDDILVFHNAAKWEELYTLAKLGLREVIDANTDVIDSDDEYE